MRSLRYLATAILAVAMLFLYQMACGGPNNPVNTRIDPENPVARDTTGARVLWGLWDVVLDGDALEFEVVPVRGAAFRANLNSFMEPPAGSPGNLGIQILDLSKIYQTGECSVRVSLTHPFPGLYTYTGFDVRGVFIHNGSRTSKYSSALSMADPSSGTDAVLLNADGYTRWFNRMEFRDEGLLGYTPGVLGHELSWSAHLNPYKAFADGLGEGSDFATWLSVPENESRRCMFRPGHTNNRVYNLRFPFVQGVPAVRFQYAVTASWSKPDPDPPINIPGHFPPQANAQEAYCISVVDAGSTLWFKEIEFERGRDMYIGQQSGGDLKLRVEVFDHQASGGSVTGQIARMGITSMSNLIPGTNNTMWFYPDDLEEMVIAGEGTNSSTAYLIQIEDLKPASLNKQEFLIVVESASPTTYNQGFGTMAPSSPPLAAYCLYLQTVHSQVPCPSDIAFNSVSKINTVSLDTTEFAGERTVAVRDQWLFAVWCQEINANDRDILFARSWNGGSTWSSPVEVNPPDTTGNQESPSLAVPPSGALYVAYRDSSVSPARIVACRSADIGMNWTDHSTVHDNSPTGTQWGDWPVIGVDEDHLVHCCWVDNRLGYPVIFHSRAQDGMGWSADIQVNDGYAPVMDDQDAIDMFVDSWGTVHAVWSDLRNTMQGYGTTIYYDRFDEDGIRWGTDVRVDHDNSGPYASTSPTIAVDNAGEIHVAWIDNRDTAGGNHYLYYTRSENNGLSFLSEVRVFDAAATSSPEGMLGPGGVPYLVFHATYRYTDQRVLFLYTCDGGDDFIGPLNVISGSSGVRSPGGMVGEDGTVCLYYIERLLNPLSVDFFLSTGEPVFPLDF